jgi:sporulation protein YlmC with PRC-barrel domain
MSDIADFEIDAPVECSDGPCGNLARVIIDPVARRVTHLVVEPNHRVGLGRLVPVALAEATSEGIRLGCTQAELDQFELSERVEMLPGTQASTVFGSPYLMGNETLPLVHDIVPDGTVELAPGTPVHATDGEIGKLEGVVADQQDETLKYLLLQEGHLWGRKRVAISMSSVSSVSATTGVWLSLTKDEVRDLPPVPED